MLKFENRKFQLISNVHCLERMAANPVEKLTNLFDRKEASAFTIPMKPSSDIVSQLNSQHIMKKLRNRTSLECVFKTMKVLARQGLPFVDMRMMNQILFKYIN